jgi:uracil-DNA glycosylase family 4
VLLWGESPAVDEQISGVPFTGAAGSMLTRCLRLIGKTREQVRVDNVVRGTFLAPLEAHPEAVRGCQYRNDVLAQAPPQVLVPMGAVALREALGLTGTKGVRVQDFHGTVTRDPTNRFWVVPTYHPSHLQRGATNLMGTVAFDLRRAFDVAKSGWAPDPGRLVIDPPVEWFRAWVELAVAARHQSPDAFPLAVDIETPDKATDEGDFYGKADEGSWQIKRVNVSVDPDEGVTVPFEGEYITLLMHLLAGPGVQYYWFKGFDVPRLVKAGAAIQPEEAYDLMWAWKALQSDLPGGLGFAAPFYSTWGAWKHLAETDEARYGAIDGLQTRRVGDGVVGDLVKEGRWDVFRRHQHDFHRLVLQPATDVGVPIDRARLLAFKATLDTEATRLIDTIAALAPPEVTPLTPKLGLTRPPASILYTKANAFKRDGTPKKEAPDPVKAALYTRARVVEKLVVREVTVCVGCGAKEIAKTHKCAATQITKAVATVRRWFWQEPFNPDSPQQLMAYVLAKGHTPGKAKATGNDSVDRETLSRLIRETEDPFYQAILDYRAVGKVRSTYVVGTEKRLDADDRVHPTFSFKPSTMRLSAQNPNVQNAVHDEGKSLAGGYRLCVVAKRASWIVEVDYSAIESVVSGWAMRDPTYIRYARLGVHAIVASHVLGAPADLTLDDRQLGATLKALKQSPDPRVQTAYARSKRLVHGTTYGMSIHGMQRNYPSLFPTLKAADAIRDVYFSLAPGVPAFQTACHATAHETHHLGGPPPYHYDQTTRRVSGHPFGYQHWFWSVVSYKRLTLSQRLWHEKRKLPVTEINGIFYSTVLGEDANRCSAFYGQSIARGILTEACFPLFDLADPLADHCYIGDAYYGVTPLRAPIHDSLLLEIPTDHVERVVARVALAMRRPIAALPCPAVWGMGEALTVGVDAKIGPDWGTMHALELPTTDALGVAAEARAESDEAEDVDEILDLATRIA